MVEDSPPPRRRYDVKDFIVLILMLIGVVAFAIVTFDAWRPTNINLVAGGLLCWLAALIIDKYVN